VRQRLTLSPGSRVLQVEQETDWHEVETFLKVAFPLDVQARETLAETQFGFQRRPTHVNTSWEAAKFEVSMHRWVLAAEPGFGVGLVNDSTYGYDVTRDERADGPPTVTLRLSLLRAPRFPDPETDQGRQTHRFGLVIGADVATVTAEGAVLNTPARVVRGEHAVAPLVRVHEALGARTTGVVRVDAPVGSVHEVSLLEEELASGDVPTDADGGIPLQLNGFEVRTFRIRLADAASRAALAGGQTTP
jgi:alpha-mannosidase